jgi:taurine dioxygenase
VLLVRGASLEPSEYLSFAKQMGALVPFVDLEYRHPEHPEIFVVSNVQRDGKKFGMDRVGYYWHSDSSFLKSPLPLTMLHSQIVPEQGGETAFIDMVGVYERLPESLHEGKWRYLITDNDIGLSIQEILERDEKLVPTPTHPMVVIHPVTGRKALYMSEGITRRILGLSEEHSESILGDLWTRIERDPSYYQHVWGEKELLIWDNRSVIHRAFPNIPGQRRLMFRIGVNDGPFFASNTPYTSENTSTEIHA